jgi:predicted nucleic acid-binding protein
VKGETLVDTGPLVAFLNRRDRYHAWAKERLQGAEPPLLTCEAVLSEACFLLRGYERGPEAVIDLVARGLLAVLFDLAREAAPLKLLLSRYAEVPMALADACLVRMSELHPDAVLLTLDSDFRIYRRNRRSVIPTLMPATADRPVWHSRPKSGKPCPGRPGPGRRSARGRTGGF